MFRRNYPINASKEQNEYFIENIQEVVNRVWYWLHKNDYPYNMLKDQPVETDHWTLWYKERNHWRIQHLIDIHIKHWYAIIENWQAQKSVPEVSHMHFIKVL